MTGSQTPDHAVFEPIFVVGHPRSGTTLLASLLDSHTQVAVPPETHFFDATRRWGGRDERLPVDTLVQELQRNPRLGDLGLDPEDIRRRLGGGQSSLSVLLRAALEAYAEQRGKPRAAEKTPGHLWYVEQIIRWYPAAVVIWIVRDGRDCVGSLLRMPWTHSSVRLHSLQWQRSSSTCRRWQRRFPDRVLRIRYEDLLADPDAQFTRIQDFAGLAREPVRHEDRSSDLVPEWEVDWKDKSTQELDASRTQAWRRETTSRQLATMNVFMGPELRRLGYAQEPLYYGGWLRRGWNGITKALFALAFHPRLHRYQTGLKSFVERFVPSFKLFPRGADARAVAVATGSAARDHVDPGSDTPQDGEK
jgi:hypothetical protein